VKGGGQSQDKFATGKIPGYKEHTWGRAEGTVGLWQRLGRGGEKGKKGCLKETMARDPSTTRSSFIHKKVRRKVGGEKGNFIQLFRDMP